MEGGAEVIVNAEGATTPSVVSFKGGDIKVGNLATCISDQP